MGWDIVPGGRRQWIAADQVFDATDGREDKKGREMALFAVNQLRRLGLIIKTAVAKKR
jgi:hypothetical protein